MVTADAAGGGDFARSLAHSELNKREKAFARLTQWLQGTQGAKPLDHLALLKVWKGLFYAFWHSDLAPVQRELAERMSKLLFAFKTPKAAQAFLGAFLETMRREWFGIDKLRMDKFMLLARLFLDSTFDYFASKDWDSAVVCGFMTTLATHGLREEITQGIGFTLHMTDIYPTEILLEEGKCLEAPAEALAALLAPFVGVLAQHGNATVLKRVQADIFTALLADLAAHEKVGKAKANAVREQLAAQVTALAEDPEGARTPKNRKFLYDTLKTLEKKIKQGEKGNKRAAEEAPPPAHETEEKAEPPKKKKKKAKAAEEEAEAAASTSVDTAAEPPSAGKKAKKIKAVPATPEGESSDWAVPSAAEWSDGVLQDDWIGDAEPAGGGEKKKKTKAKSALKQAVAGGGGEAPSTPTPSSTPVAADGFATPQGGATDTPAPKRKSVRISLKNNIEFPPNSKPLSPSIRTPLRAQPKGPALKKVSKWPNTFGPSSAPPKGSKSMLATPTPAPPATETKKGKKGKAGKAANGGSPGHTPAPAKRKGGFLKYGDGDGDSADDSPSPSSAQRRARAADFF